MSEKPHIRLPPKASVQETRALLETAGVYTVCQEASCPNRWECFGNKTATFLILGDVCTRNCAFCDIKAGVPLLLNPDEPKSIASAAEKLGLKYVVITCVTRDDLPDGGARQFVEVIRAVRAKLPKTAIEVLTSDFDGNVAAIESVLDEKPEVFNHNIETVERFTPLLRSKAAYLRSLAVLEHAGRYAPDIPVKSGLMVGLGESEDEVKKTLEDLRKAGCKILTIGQYFAPSKNHYPVKETISEEKFEKYKTWAKVMGFSAVAAGPMIRSSYNAAGLILPQSHKVSKKFKNFINQKNGGQKLLNN